jgi:hypothetical protein
MLQAIVNRAKALQAFEKLTVIFVVMIFLGELYLRTSAPAAVALTFTQHNAAVQSAVGGVENARLGWIGNIHYAGNQGWASFAMHITGARTNATMAITLQREHGRWNVESGRLVTDSGHAIEVSETAKAAQVCAAN